MACCRCCSQNTRHLHPVCSPGFSQMLPVWKGVIAKVERWAEQYGGEEDLVAAIKARFKKNYHPAMAGEWWHMQ